MSAYLSAMQATNTVQLKSIRLICVGCCAGLLGLHVYYYCHLAFAEWGLTAAIPDRFISHFAQSGLFTHRCTSKLLALFFLGLSLIGNNSDAPLPPRRQLIRRFAVALGVYLGSDLLLYLVADPATLASFYILTLLGGLALLYQSLKPLAARLTAGIPNDIFNTRNESFPQVERRIEGPFIFHFRGRYRLRSQKRDSHINLVDIFRGLLVMGTPGSGKTRYIFRPLIHQSLEYGMAVFVYDLKYDDLTRFTWQSLQKIKKGAPRPAFFALNFDDFTRSHRCNPLDPAGIVDVSDAAESARTILFSLNKRWIEQQGNFFVDSAINFFTASIWFLRSYENGRFCTLPHLIELIQTDYDRLFSVLRSFSENESLINSFVSAYKNNTMEQLQGQVDSARVPLAALVSPNLYYLLSANDFTLDINNPKAPKVICIASNPQKTHVYGAVVSLFVSRMLKLVNKKGGVPCHLFFDEFPSITALGMSQTLATARSNKVAVTLGIQDLSQLRAAYGRDPADALFNLPGNLISSQVSGDSARLVSERFGRILQEKSSVSTNSRDSSTNESLQLDLAVPASKIATLSSGEFVGITADSPDHPLDLKTFHARILLDPVIQKLEQQPSEAIPVVKKAAAVNVEETFKRIKTEVLELVEARFEFMLRDDHSRDLIVRKSKGFSLKL